MTCFYELNISEFVKYIKLNFVIHDINKKLKSILQWIGSNQSEISDHASQNTLESALSHQTIHSRLNSNFLRYSEILKFSKIFSFFCRSDSECQLWHYVGQPRSVRGGTCSRTKSPKCVFWGIWRSFRTGHSSESAQARVKFFISKWFNMFQI